jgi:hypothetical protein
VADLEQTVRIDASPERVYAMVSDLPRMPEWSPECTAVSWRGGATGPALGARFVGSNRQSWKRWMSEGEVTGYDPGRYFAFAIRFGPIPVALWEYVVEPAEGDGCALTERFTDRRPGPARVFGNLVTGERIELNRRGIATTLANLKSAAEAEQAGRD